MQNTDQQLDAMLQVARQRDPSIEPKAAAVILRACLDELSTDPDADPAELARRCLSRYRAADVSWVAHLAHAAVTMSRAKSVGTA